MQMNNPLVFKYYFNKQMTYFSIAVYSDLIYSTRLQDQCMASILLNAPGRVLIDLRMFSLCSMTLETWV